MEQAPVYQEQKCFIVKIKHLSCYPNINTNNYYLVGVTATGDLFKFKYYGKIDLDLSRYGHFKIAVNEQNPPVYERYGQMNIKTYYMQSIVEYKENGYQAVDASHGQIIRQPSLSLNNF